MYRRYYSYPVKQKSDKTKEFLKNVKDYEHIKQYSVIDKLDLKKLKYQKELFEKDQNLILNEYSPKNYQKKVLALKNSVKKIENSYSELLRLYKKNKDNFRIKKRYFQEQAIMFSTKVELQELFIENEKLKKLLYEENKILEKINNEDIEKKRIYFFELLKMIKFYYLYYKIEIFDDNKQSFNYHLSYSSKISNDFNSNPQISISAGIPHFSGIQLDNVQEAIDTLTVPNITLKLYECVEMDSLGESKRKIININTTKYNELSKNDFKYDDVESFVYLFDPKKIILNQNLLIKFTSKSNELINKILRRIELAIRKKTKQSQKKENFGYVYVLKSIGYPGMYKIGSTYGLAEERAEELSGTNVPDPWTVTAKIKILDALYYEKQMHKILTKYRYKKGREFFKVDISVIKKCLSNILEKSDKGRKKVTFPVLNN